MGLLDKIFGNKEDPRIAQQRKIVERKPEDYDAKTTS